MESDSLLDVFGKEFAMAFFGLLLFGILYNLLVEYFQKRTQRYTAELVVIGVLVTLGVAGFEIGWINALKVLALFAASGSPMILGSWLRTAKDEEHSRKIMKDQLDGKD